MKRITFLAAVIAGLFLFGAQSAWADDCVRLGGAIVSGECRVTTSVARSNLTAPGGPYTIAETLHITGTGKITTGGAALTINITPSGDFLMDNGAQIDASLAAGTGGAITITLDDGDVDLATGSIIRSNGKSGGAIKIENDKTPKHTMDLDGTIESVGSISGTGATQAPGGGTITIVAGCELTVSDSGLVSSRGADPGADLVHLQGCTVVIDGIVESTGPGHTNPNSPINHCNLDPAAHPDGGAAFFSACVEIWGNTVTINSIVPHKGEVRTDPPGARNPGRGWIDVFASGDITINNDTTGAYSVHANSQAGGNNSNSFGGLITVKSNLGKFTASGFALQANGPGLGSDGGDVIVQAFGDVAFGSSSIQAKAGTGGNAQGGHISAKSFNGALTGTFVTTTAGELNAANGAGATVGTVLLEACTNDPATGYAGTVTGTETDHGPGGIYCGGNPTFPVVAQWSTGVSATSFIATAATCPTTLCGGTCTKSGQKFNDLNNNNKKDAGEPGLPNWTITLWNSTQTALVVVPLPSVNPATTDASGNYSFSGLAPDTYVVCETPQAGWNQTFPVSGAGIVTCTNTSPTTKGYQFTLAFDPVTGKCEDTGNDFGNNKPSHKSGMKFRDLDTPGTVGVKDGTDPPIAGWPINLYVLASPLGAAIQTVNTDASGNYKFTIPAAGDYQVCEGSKTGFTQTFPSATSPVPPTETVVSTCPAPNIWGYTFTVTTGTELTGDDFGNHTTTSQCPEDPTAALTKSVGNPGSGVTNFDTVQAAYNAAVNGDVIGLFSNTTENLLLGGDKTLEITQCTVAKVTGVAGVAAPVWDIESTGKLTIIGPDSVGGNIGWWVGGNGGHTLKSVRANGASLVGIAILSDKNTVSWNDVSGNGPGAGIVVGGSFNSLKGGTVGPNTGDGVQVQGNSNSLSGATLNGNTGSGVVVTGSTNTIKSNKANSNGFDGFWNFGGAGNNYSGNSSNTGSTPNGLHQYEFTTAGVNGGSNRADGVNVPKTSAPPKCADFAQAGTSCD